MFEKIWILLKFLAIFGAAASLVTGAKIAISAPPAPLFLGFWWVSPPPPPPILGLGNPFLKVLGCGLTVCCGHFRFSSCIHVTGHRCHPKARPLRIAFPIQSLAFVLEFSRHPRKQGRVVVQQLAFLDNKEEKDTAILKFPENMNEVRDQSAGTQPILRAARAIVSIVIGVSQENGAYAKLVMDSARDMLFGPDPQKYEIALGDNLKAAVGMIRPDHTLGGWTAVRFLAACAAAANRDPNSPKGPKPHRKAHRQSV